jgi:hypothetical protein
LVVVSFVEIDFRDFGELFWGWFCQNVNSGGYRGEIFDVDMVVGMVDADNG